VAIDIATSIPLGTYSGAHLSADLLRTGGEEGLQAEGVEKG
jgi:hypothetical protein